MEKMLSMLSIVSLALSLGACTMTSSVDLAAVAKASNMKNITTGDGMFENYTATGQFKGREIGFGIGFPFIKILEIYPGKSNEALLTELAKLAASPEGGKANAMINVCPASETFAGFIIGVYIDSCRGTGIKLK
jgi:hypothetical protein